MHLHAALQPLLAEHQRLLKACGYLKTQHAIPLTTQERLIYVVKVFQEEMVPHIQKEAYIFEACKGKVPELDFMIGELEAEHLHLSRLYSTLTETAELDNIIDQIANDLEAHILKEEQHVYLMMQHHLPDVIDKISW